MQIRNIGSPEINPINNNGRRIRVLEIIGNANRGGMENYLVEFLKNIPKDIFSVTCICPHESLFTRELRRLGAEDVFITPISDNPDWRSVQMTLEIARLFKADLLHAHMPKAHILAGLAGNLLNLPVLATLHGMHVTAYELSLALTFKSHLVVNCQETYIQALALGIPADAVSLFPNGVSTGLFTGKPATADLRQRLHLKSNTVLVGFVGRLEYEKGPDMFLRAAAYVHQELPKVHFVMVGAGSMEKQLKKQSTQMQQDAYMHFIDWIDHTPDVYPSLNLLAHCSRNDGTSLVLLEAMASCIPVVGMAVGGVREIIENEHTGIIVDANDCEALAFQIVRLLEKPELLQSMGKAGRERVEGKFDVRKNTAQIAGLMQSLVADAGELRSIPLKQVQANPGIVL